MSTGLFAECWNCGARTLVVVIERNVTVGDTLHMVEHDAVQAAVDWSCDGCGSKLRGSKVLPGEYPED